MQVFLKFRNNVRNLKCHPTLKLSYRISVSSLTPYLLRTGEEGGTISRKYDNENLEDKEENKRRFMQKQRAQLIQNLHRDVDCNTIHNPANMGSKPWSD
jgi:hypothetical protein